MKKFLPTIIIVLISLAINTHIALADTPETVTFIYINGSNDYNYQNRLKFKAHFEKQVEKIHPKIKKGLENDKLIQQIFLQNGKYVINPEPIVFYWGDKSLIEIEKIDEWLNQTKKSTPKMAQIARSFFAHCLHDAIWVQKPQNMAEVIDDLQEEVIKETAKGHKVVLFGYSAGSFITYQYFLNKFTSIKPKELVSEFQNLEFAELINTTEVNPTCLDALMERDIVRLGVNGDFYINKNKKEFIENYKLLNQQTEKTCFKVDEIKGVVNFASPLILFYSNIADSSTSLNFLSQLMVKNIVENNIFFITVNYNNDPLGLPSYENLNYNDLKNSNSILAQYLTAGNGFIYNKSDVYVPRTFISAHLAYWDTPKSFLKGIIAAFNDGYNYFYGLSKP